MGYFILLWHSLNFPYNYFIIIHLGLRVHFYLWFPENCNFSVDIYLKPVMEFAEEKQTNII